MSPPKVLSGDSLTNPMDVGPTRPRQKSAFVPAKSISDEVLAGMFRRGHVPAERVKKSPPIGSNVVVSYLVYAY